MRPGQRVDCWSYGPGTIQAVEASTRRTQIYVLLDSAPHGPTRAFSPENVKVMETHASVPSWVERLAADMERNAAAVREEPPDSETDDAYTLGVADGTLRWAAELRARAKVTP